MTARMPALALVKVFSILPDTFNVFAISSRLLNAPLKPPGPISIWPMLVSRTTLRWVKPGAGWKS